MPMPFSEKMSRAASSNSRRRSSAGRLRLRRLLGLGALLAGSFVSRRWRFSTRRVWHGKRAVGISAHGLRTALATRLANKGATTHELEALFGWRGGGMASLYTRSANR